MNQFNKSLSGISTINDINTNDVNATTGTITTLNSSSITSSGNINLSNSSSSYQIGGVNMLSSQTDGLDVFSVIPSCIVTDQLLVGNAYGGPQVAISYDNVTTTPCIFGITEGVGTDPIQIGKSGLGGCSLNILNGSLLMNAATVIDGSRNLTCNSINQASTTGSSCGYINGLTSASTTISASNTWIVPSGTFTSTFSTNATVLSSGCGYTINGSVTQYYMVKCDCSVNGTSGTNLSIGLSVNSATPSPINIISITGATYQPISVSGVLSLASADTIQLMINNLSNTDSVTINQINFSVVPCNFI